MAAEECGPNELLPSPTYLWAPRQLLKVRIRSWQIENLFYLAALGIERCLNANECNFLLGRLENTSTSVNLGLKGKAGQLREKTEKV